MIQTLYTMKTEDGWNTTYRIREYRIPVRMVLTMMFRQPQLPYYVALPECSIPDGARILSMEADPMRMFFRCWVEHESFDVVPEGCDPPMGDDNPIWRMYELKERMDEPTPTVVTSSQETLGG